MKTELTIEESARLIELGVDAELASHTENNFYNGITDKEFKVWHRFTLTDLLSILPKEIDGYHLNIEAITEGYNVGYLLWGEDAPWCGVIEDSKCERFAPELIDALNQLAIWLLTEKKINLNNIEQ